MLTQQAMGWNRKKTENLHKVLAHRYIKISERAKLEAASFSEFQKKNHVAEQTVQQWVVTELVSTPGNTEDLRAEIESITVSLLCKKQDLYRQHDSNQIRQRKRKKIRDLKKKLREKILQYNSAEEDKIDEEMACSLTEDYILPWERLGDAVIASVLFYAVVCWEGSAKRDTGRLHKLVRKAGSVVRHRTGGLIISVGIK
ncbi:hypothetical protein QQF64_017386 [Cirrhinus molitorella]|uniref:Uncharacterized protein n=1 Tax=Cirrhinus molitorella TaxID=172907 RepID=A0ABR3LMJ5_9TELE